MRTTIDIPENLLRLAKAQAALRGLPLKEFVAESIRLALGMEKDRNRQAGDVNPEANRQQLSEDCVFPLITGDCGPSLPDLTPERLHEILEEEDLERALGSRRH